MQLSDELDRRMSRCHIFTFICSLTVLGCGWIRPEGQLVGGSVRIICGDSGRPCNFHITAPAELTRARVSVDGSCVVTLFPNQVEHPYRTLLLTLVGVQPSSTTAVATFHLPSGSHVVSVSHPDWWPIERTIFGTGSSQRIEFVIRKDELSKIRSR
jgi:hypothetical protein